jgi:hypothetical protein
MATLENAATEMPNAAIEMLIEDPPPRHQAQAEAVAIGSHAGVLRPGFSGEKCARFPRG